ncbi:Crp/Fnr family transcriptional regulator [Tenacibaculum haliotis]|uniref:Crp/Fnr family transcriptional regulator n=1 Tax=Tenacibaculum haliotis TaxID=1888914 RepID=UPI0021B0575D|nr:Crp/Fnr family transcriptional regulator [Tenacibaculum haliotis]MCT4698194.1 Crp/Fnr family transcriptional regulator [Tenacibaculum haliotis]
MKNDIEIFLSRFLKLPKNLVVAFEELLTYTELEPFEFFTKINERPTDFIIIKTGLIRSYIETEDGKEITRHLFTPISLSCSLSTMVREIPATVNYQALTKVTGYRGNFYKFKELALKHHELSLLYVKMLEGTYLEAESIILTLSAYDATERYLRLKKRIPDIDNLIAQKYIASYLNVSPVQLSRIKKSLLK